MSWNLWTLAGKGAIFLLLWSLFKRNHNNLFQKVRDKIEDLGTYSQQGDQVLQSPNKAKYSGQRSSIRILSLRSGWDWPLFILTNTGGSHLNCPRFCESYYSDSKAYKANPGWQSPFCSLCQLNYTVLLLPLGQAFVCPCIELL